MSRPKTKTREDILAYKRAYSKRRWRLINDARCHAQQIAMNIAYLKKKGVPGY